MPPIAKLALEDGTLFTGTAFGAIGGGAANPGEVVFNTSLSGYQEILTDPSYKGQIVTMTYPQIGNYGIADETDFESAHPQVEGFIIKELSPIASNFRSIETLDAYLKRYNIPGIAGIDTRALVRKLRIQGALKGVICTDQELVKDDAELVRRANAWAGMNGLDLVKVVAPTKAYAWDQPKGPWAQPKDHLSDHWPLTPDNSPHVVAVDCGLKRNILRNLAQSGCRVTVVPAATTADEILAHKPDGIFISNGPGDPEPVHYVQDALKKLIGKKPIFGICLGHQLLGLAMGATTYKLKFGHRGGNQPVRNTGTGKVEITSQNHGFAVDPDSLRRRGGEPTHINLNDNTLEGFRHNTEPVFAVQYHPEASPGPHDATYLFDCFREMIKTGKSPTAEQMNDAQKRRNAV
ncbi:MAG TPA: glutamine-hydrolyzing carbamoyl-phosphate synthase small subunit [Phycisphaerae bacterium]|jgi:carbamoyl-phosphate synthase small subunit